MKILLVAAIVAAMTGPAMAQSLESMTLAKDLGSVLASEETCGLTFDQAAVAKFVEDKVPADDMGFASTLNAMVIGQDYQLKKMTASSKTAHCTQIARVAKTYNFIH